MKLDRVQIRNFRSIKDAEIKFDTTCKILVGINESGKSNILKALAMLDDRYKPIKTKDVRDALPEEDNIAESYVYFIFKFEKEDTNILFQEVSNSILTTSNNSIILTGSNEPIKLREFCNTRNEGLFTVNLISGIKMCQYWVFPQGLKIANGWKKPSKNCPIGYSIMYNGIPRLLSSFSLLETKASLGIPQQYLETATLKDVEDLFGKITAEIVDRNKPRAIFWQYDERNLLPNAIKINDFCDNPDICTPLKNMFILAGIKDIKSSIVEASKGSRNQFQNYLNRIAKQTTIHFCDVWKEYRDIQFSLEFNMDSIIPGIKEQNTHDFERRSDGFKRFVTFLLLISVGSKIENLSNTLLIVDEPDVTLHPSGVRYLRDELIRISNKNYVVFSTHSIFMIDSTDIGKHYIVKKTREITSIETVGDANISDEEVLYNALGFSVFSILNPRNILFEGWNDKKIYQIAIENANAVLKKKFKDVSTCHAKGVKSIKAITPLIELAKRKCIIISDSDDAALEQKKLYEADRGYGKWLTYQDIDSTLTEITGEDFIKNDFIVSKVKETLPEFLLITSITSNVLKSSNKTANLNNWLMGSTNKLTKDQAKDCIKKVKDKIYDSLEHSHIEASYNKILKGIIID